LFKLSLSDMDLEIMEKSSVVRHSVKGGRGEYYRTTIPKKICEKLGLQPGDVLAWEIEERNGRKVAVLRKLE